MPIPIQALSIVEATTISYEKFHENLFLRSALTASERRRALKIILDPFWRPLCELEVNGTTTYEGALLLLSSRFIHSKTFQVRHGHAVGSFIEYVDFTDAGLQLFSEYAGQEYDDGLRERLINSLMCYAAIDNGNGIVARRSAIEAAIDIDDEEFLIRLRSVSVGTYSFSGFEAGMTATLAERTEALAFVSGWDGERTGAEIVQLGSQNRQC